MPGSLPAVLQQVGESSFEGVEFAHRYADADTPRVAATLVSSGLDVVAAHVGLEAMMTEAQRLFDDYAPVCCRHFVLPHVPSERLATRSEIELLAEQLTAAADAVEATGNTVAYHNQAHDFVTVDGQHALDRLLERTPSSIGLELDVGGAVTAGVDPVDVIERHGDRITMLHLKDVAVSEPAPNQPQRCVPIGTGDVDFDAVARAARAANVEWLIYENDDPEDPEEALQRGAKVLSGLR
jgi:sugar phosphate isomerase/epimerase